MTVITRFAPSPTGFLHIGGARTALFNWLFAKNQGGKFMLRIEDTDRERSTQEAVDAIIDGMEWLGLEWDEAPVFQFDRSPRHAEVAMQMLKEGKAYNCYATQSELEEFRTKNPGAKFRSPWRDGGTPPAGIPPVIRLKAPRDGKTTVHDKVEGEVTIENTELDDMVLLRSDGTPTYMLAVVVDDHDMNITHVIRGQDHLTNTFRQLQIYNALGWKAPEFAHIPLIHGADGAKLSKRHGALGVDAYREMGYLPEALRNYLLRLGWSHGDDEIIFTEQAIKWFNLESIGKSPSKFDFTKLESVNAHYIKEMNNKELIKTLIPFLNKEFGRKISDDEKVRIENHGLLGAKNRSKTLVELAKSIKINLDAPSPTFKKLDPQEVISVSGAAISAVRSWSPEVWHSHTTLDQNFKKFVESNKFEFKKVGPILREGLTGSQSSLPIPEIMGLKGKETVENNLNTFINLAKDHKK